MERRSVVGGVLLILAGAGLWLFVVRPLLGPSKQTWAVQIAQDAIPLTQLVRLDVAIENTAEIDAAWEKRRVLYDEEHLAEMRRRLNAFVDFQVVEYGDAKEIYDTGRRPEKPSQSAIEAQDRLREAFGSTADEMIRQYAERVREKAFQASPAIAKGKDPDLLDYDEVYRLVIEERLPEARATVERLTAPSR